MGKMTRAELMATFPGASEAFLIANGAEPLPAASPDAPGTHRKKKNPQDSSPRMSEAEFQDAVMAYAESHGWIVKHISDARRFTKNGPVGDVHASGIPDLLLIKPPRIMLIELKTMVGKLRPEQERVLNSLYNCSEFYAGLWRPADMDAAFEILAA